MAISSDPQFKTQLAPQPTRRRGAPTVRHPLHPLHTRPHVVRLPRAKTRHVAVPGMAAQNIALAGLQLIVGYEWLVSGLDKVLLGTFPSQLPGLLAAATSSGRLPGFFAALLQQFVAPHAVLFGLFIEWAETLGGLGLMSAGLVTLLRPWAERYLNVRAATIFLSVARLLDGVSLAAAAGTGLLGLSYFLLDGLPTPWFTPSVAYGGAIDTGLFLAAASAVLVTSQLIQWRRQSSASSASSSAQ